LTTSENLQSIENLFVIDIADNSSENKQSYPPR